MLHNGGACTAYKLLCPVDDHVDLGGHGTELLDVFVWARLVDHVALQLEALEVLVACEEEWLDEQLSLRL